MKILLTLFLASVLTAQTANEIHFKSIVVDMHADALDSYFKTGRSLENNTGRGHVDLERLKIGGVDVQFFSVWPDPKAGSLFNQAVTILDTLDTILDRNSLKIKLAKSSREIREIVNSGKIAACIGLEGGAVLEDNLENLHYFFGRGVRYLSLTWDNSPSWASSAKDEQSRWWHGKKGLSTFGITLIKKMNALGMMVDISHSGEQTFWDVISVSSKPVIASHSSVYEICPHQRNLKDKQIKALAKSGGAVFINFNPRFLVAGLDKAFQRARKDATVIQDSLEVAGSGEELNRIAYIFKQIDHLYPSVSNVVDHIDYVVKLVGDDYVGLGSDFDGIPMTPIGLRNVSHMTEITKELVKRGYSEKSIQKILGGNLLRIMDSL